MSLSPDELKLIGGSDASALVGLNPYKSPHDVFARIVEGVEDPETKAMRRGTLLEPVIRAMAAEEFGIKFLGPRKLRLGEWGRASLDDVVEGSEGEEPAEFKSVSPWVADEYGETGSDEVPSQHLCQVQFYLYATLRRRARLFALVGTDDLRQFVIHADADLQEMLVSECERFWKDHVLTGVPPPIDATPSCEAWLARRFPKAGSELVEADEEATEIAARLRAARAQKAEAEAIEQECRNQLIDRIGAAAGIRGEGWKVTYKTSKGRTKTNWEGVAELLKAPKEFIELHTTIGAPYRVFKPTFQKESK